MQNQEPQIDSQETALRVLIQGINLAQSRGAYNLSEASLLDKCIKAFTRKPEEAQQQMRPQAEPAKDTVIKDDDKDVNVETISI